MRIPEVRTELLVLANTMLRGTCSLHQASVRIQELVEELKRRPANRGRRTAPATASVQLGILEFSWKHPKASGREIAAVFNVSSGRGSEIHNGKRT